MNTLFIIQGILFATGLVLLSRLVKGARVAPSSPSPSHMPRDSCWSGCSTAPRRRGQRPDTPHGRGHGPHAILCVNAAVITSGCLRRRNLYLQLPSAYHVFRVTLGILGLLSVGSVGLSASTVGVFERAGVQAAVERRDRHPAPGQTSAPLRHGGERPGVTREPQHRPLRADEERNRQPIMRTADRRIADRGSSVALNEIAREAGVGVGVPALPRPAGADRRPVHRTVHHVRPTLQGTQADQLADVRPPAASRGRVRLTCAHGRARILDKPNSKRSPKESGPRWTSARWRAGCAAPETASARRPSRR